MMPRAQSFAPYTSRSDGSNSSNTMAEGHQTAPRLEQTNRCNQTAIANNRTHSHEQNEMPVRPSSDSNQDPAGQGLNPPSSGPTPPNSPTRKDQAQAPATTPHEPLVETLQRALTRISGKHGVNSANKPVNDRAYPYEGACSYERLADILERRFTDSLTPTLSDASGLETNEADAIGNKNYEGSRLDYKLFDKM